MNRVGTVESLWRYPVKSMRGEEMPQIFAGFAGVYGDRLFSFHSSAGVAGFPFLTGRNLREMILYRARFRDASKAAAPPNLVEAQNLGPGITPVYANPSDLMIDVETPTGQVFRIDDPALIDTLRAGLDEDHHLTLHRSERAMTDCRPLSLISVQTVRALTDETGNPVDKRQFRANIYLDLTEGNGFGEDRFVGRSLRLGSKLILSILERDPRCMMITLDPDTAEKTPALLKTVAQTHQNKAGVYAAVLVEGVVQQGDAVELLD